MCGIGVIFKLLFITQAVEKGLQKIKVVMEHQHKYVNLHFDETNIFDKHLN